MARTKEKRPIMVVLYTILVAIYPILSIYATFIDGLSVADLLLVFLSIALTVETLAKNRLFKGNNSQMLGLFLFYIVFSYIFQTIAGTGVSFLSTARYALYIYCLISFTYLFDFTFGIKVLGFFVLASSFYLIIQFIALKLFSVALPWHLPFKVIDQSFDLLANSSYYLDYHRPTGFFYEPTHFSQYCLVYLTYLLFVDKTKRKWIKIAVVSIAIMCSGSSAGLFMVAIIFALAVFCSLFDKKGFLQAAIIISLGLVGVLVIVNVPYFATIVKRVFSNGDFSGAAVGYRFNSATTLFDGSKSIASLVLGTGRGTENGLYFTAIFYIINAYGFVGLSIYVLIFVSLFMQCKSSFSRSTLIVVFVLSIGSEMVCNFGILTYFTYVLAFDNKVKEMLRSKSTINQVSLFSGIAASRSASCHNCMR